MGLSAPLLKVLPELNIDQPTEIQQKAIPILLKEKERDFLGLAQTGTGKTAAFGLPLLDAVDPDLKRTQALVLAPTRELGQQIAQQFQAFSKYMKGLRVQVVYGGASIVPQMKALKNTPHIIIATPGRLLDLINRKSIDLSGIKHVVFDEADEMLNMGFREDIDHILSYTEGQKSTWLFSATMAPEIKSIVKKYMDNPSEVKIDAANVVNQNIDHKYFIAKAKDKVEIMKRIIELEPDMRGIVFCRTKRETQQLAEELQKKGLPVDAIHGDLSQNQRDQVMKRFKNHSLEFLIATDVAARGIDVNDLTHVIHYSMPDDLEYYTHRSGRTGRAGKKGISLALITSAEQRKVSFIQKKLNLNFSQYVLPKAEHVENKRLMTWADTIISTEADHDMIAEHVNDVREKFNGLTKEDLIDKLITWELNELGLNKKSAFDENQTLEDTPTHSRHSATHDKYFINVGLIDGVNEKELVDFVSETVGISKSALGKINIDDKKSYFEIEKESSHLVGPAFSDLYVDNRKLRVNKEVGQKSQGRGGRKDRSKRRISKHGKPSKRRR
ncbi:DEAD/DEAH box helicase [Fulvivirga lutea]|uniref:RNA helicase n=1 Tax=Fulvivirga lutea TaxID=2810512 RepID=A0A974WDW3_9BACT|nr:DEAD/DEAH box helicase [Fulvivirga lutea]QSE96419.1 DEAD/DEAH box helicase [Fulvivirga lutea]